MQDANVKLGGQVQEGEGVHRAAMHMDTWARAWYHESTGPGHVIGYCAVI